MSHAKQVSMRKRRGKAMPVLGAASLLALAGGASAEAPVDASTVASAWAAANVAEFALTLPLERGEHCGAAISPLRIPQTCSVFARASEWSAVNSGCADWMYCWRWQSHSSYEAWRAL
jgi:hypothetical protein